MSFVKIPKTFAHFVKNSNDEEQGMKTGNLSSVYNARNLSSRPHPQRQVLQTRFIYPWSSFAMIKMMKGIEFLSR